MRRTALNRICRAAHRIQCVISSRQRLKARRRLYIGWTIALAMILLVECGLFNMPFWSSLAASTDSAAASNMLGPGVKRLDDGLLQVTDPTGAYMQVQADGTSSFIRIDPVQVDADAIEHGDNIYADMSDDERATIRTTLSVRADGDGDSGQIQSISLESPRSLYMRCNASESVRLWLLAPTGTVLPIEAVRANVHVPFSFDPLRIGIMLVFVVLLTLWRPGSRLWRITLDPSRRRQRLAFAALLSPFAVATVAIFLWQAYVSTPLSFRTPGSYTYDFDQYAHVADALLHGHAWLDLPMPEALAEASNPYDPQVRDALLADGVTPIYWDYAMYDGHWYSYFGVIPAVLLYLPYQAITSLWTDGGLTLPTSAAMMILLFAFLVFGLLLVIRIVQRIDKNTSLAATSMLCVLFLLGANLPYLMFRTNFYSVPVVASLALTSLGLWFWLGAAMPQNRAQSRKRGMWQIEGAPALSLPHVAAGALCVAANLGCRPTFAVAALLAFPIFHTQIVALLSAIRNHVISIKHALAAPAAMLLPAIIVVLPLLAYNMARFDSPFQFGNDYQITVSDMTANQQTASNFWVTVGYYLLLPLHFTDRFPFLALSPTPLPQWGFAEPVVGGFFVMLPLALAAFAAIPRHSRFVRRQWRYFAIACMLLALFLLVFDTHEGGLGWRYMTDFGWLVVLAAFSPILTTLNGPKTSLQSRARMVTCLLLMFSLLLMLASLFVIGRSDSLLQNNPTLYHDVRAWFSLL